MTRRAGRRLQPTAMQAPLSAAFLPAGELQYSREPDGFHHLVLGGEVLPCAIWRDTMLCWHAVLFWSTEDGRDYTTLQARVSKDEAGKDALDAFLTFWKETS